MRLALACAVAALAAVGPTGSDGSITWFISRSEVDPGSGFGSRVDECPSF